MIDKTCLLRDLGLGCCVFPFCCFAQSELLFFLKKYNQQLSYLVYFFKRKAGVWVRSDFLFYDSFFDMDFIVFSNSHYIRV